MSELPAFQVTWTTLDQPYSFTAPAPTDGGSPSLTPPAGPPVVMVREAWLALREALRLLGQEGEPGTEQRVAPPAPATVNTRPRPPGPANRGRPWTSQDEERACAAFDSGDDPADISKALGRTRGAVLARLVRLGLLDEEEAGLRYPQPRAAGAGPRPEAAPTPAP